MIETLNFVRGAVSSGDAVIPVLTHFCIYAGRIQGANGRLYIDAPLADIKFETVVPAERFLRAIDSCGSNAKLRFTDAGRLVVEKKPFRAMLPTQKLDSFPRGIPSKGERIKLKDADGLLATLRQLRPFIANDAERAWASTILFEEGTAYSSTNAMIAMMTCKTFGDRQVQLPVFAVDELLRIGEAPSSYSSDDTGITFYFEEKAGSPWLKTQRIAAEWPVETARDWLKREGEYRKIPEHLDAAVEKLLPFCPDPKFPVVHFKGKTISTAKGDTEAEIDGFDLGGEASFHAENLLPMLRHTEEIAITDRAALFKGKNFKGVLALLRVA